VNLTAAIDTLRTFKTDPEFDSLDPTIRRAITKVVASHPPTKAPRPIPHLRTPEDAAWSKAIKKDAHRCEVCEKPKQPYELEAMHCVPRANDSLRPDHDTHSVLGGCCLRHDRTNGAPGCLECHRPLDRNAAAREVFWREWFAKQGYPADHYDRLFEESRHSHKILPRREVAS
jgi:hypothetical protein